MGGHRSSGTEVVSWERQGMGGETYCIDAVNPEVLEGGMAGDLLGSERCNERNDGGRLHDVRSCSDTEYLE